MIHKPLSALEVLVLDAQDSHSLAAIRSLGRQGARVTAASPKSRSMGSLSRYRRDALQSPNPTAEPQAYANWLLATLERERFDALLFFGEASANIVAQHRDRIRALTGCLVPGYDTFLKADRKDRVMRVGASTGIPVPATHEVERLAEASDLADRLTFPAVVKAVCGSGGHQVRFVRDRRQFVDAVGTLLGSTPDGSPMRCLVQEYIPGVGYGFTALVAEGDIVADFMHRRLAEHDISRGAQLAHAATGAESVDEPELRASGRALLRALEWDGMAMVEFRRSTRDDRFYLMEVNPRFPGSLDLAIAAGVDFPALYVQRAAGQLATGPDRYAVGLRYRWVLSKGVVEAAENPLGYVRSVASLLRIDTRCDVSLRDPRPHLAQVREAAWWVRRNWRERTPVDATARDARPRFGAPARVQGWLSRDRGVVPAAFYGVILAAMHGFTYPRGDHRLDLAWEAVCLSIGLLGLVMRTVTVGYAAGGASIQGDEATAPASLDTTGLYSVMQHPFEMGTLLMWFGVAAFPRKWWLPALAMVVFWLCTRRSIMTQEGALRRKFGVEYADWAAVTPRFLPRFSLWRRPQGRFALGRVLRREHTALLTLVACFTCLEVAGDWSITNHVSIDLEWTSLFATTVVTYILLFILKQRRYSES